MARTYPAGVYVVFALFSFLMAATSVIQGLLVLYLTKTFLISDAAAYSLYAAYGSSLYAASLYGGYVGQRFLGVHKATVIGLFLCVCGTLLLLMPWFNALILGLACFALGSGLIYPNIYCLLGRLYDVDKVGRDSAFTLAYTGMNLGALVGFLAAGYLQDYISYRAAFLFAILMVAGGLLLNIGKQNVFPQHEAEQKDKRTFLLGIVSVATVIPVLFLLLHYHHLCRALVIGTGFFILVFLSGYILQQRKIQSELPYRFGQFVLLAIFTIIFWSLYMLQPTALILFIERNVDRSILGTVIPASSIMAFNPVYMIFLGPLLSYLWLYLNKKNITISAYTKFSLGLIILGGAFLVLALGIYFAKGAGYSSLAWLGAYFLLLSVAEMIIAPAGYAVVGVLTPEKWHGFMLGVLQLMIGVAAAFSGILAQLMARPASTTLLPKLTNPTYLTHFLHFGVVALGAGIISCMVFRCLPNKN